MNERDNKFEQKALGRLNKEKGHRHNVVTMWPGGRERGGEEAEHVQLASCRNEASANGTTVLVKTMITY